MNDPGSQADYIQYRNKFDKSLVKLFPDRLPNNMLGFGYGAPHENGSSELHLTIKYFLRKQYNEAKTKYLNQSIHQRASSDKCFFFIGKENKEKCKVFYPIPKEAILETSGDLKSKSRINESEVFFIDFRPGDFLQGNKLQSELDLPENWTHGYSTGVTANDNNRIIKFWLVVW